jgi:hypothetical protein
MVIIGVLVLALLAAAVMGWWQGWFTPASQQTDRSAPARRTPSR